MTNSIFQFGPLNPRLITFEEDRHDNVSSGSISATSVVDTKLSKEIYKNMQSVSGREKCMCCSSPALCYGHMRSSAIHNSFTSHYGIVIRACHANRADCQ